MSTKHTAKLSRSNKKNELERKRDERAARRALAKARKNHPQDDDEGAEFLSFSTQLQAMGLKLREVPGDGNCLFRALGDQLEGHSRSHLELRQETVQYMMSHRQDFEPFVEDDIPFTEHLSNLAQPGTFAGNDAIVAFARSQQVKVVIHQLNTPLWEINGTEKQMCRELHIAYRYGDHYDSVRRIGDNSESRGRLRIQVYIGRWDLSVPRLILHTQTQRAHTASLIQSLASVFFLPESGCPVAPYTHGDYTQPPSCEVFRILNIIQGVKNVLYCQLLPLYYKTNITDLKTIDQSVVCHCQVPNKQKKEEKKQKKKKHQEDRNRLKVLNNRVDQNKNLPEAVTLIPALNTLSI
uniref:OTU domain-containing protein 3 n=1 Tax=Hippocampus comes TaxID=109280 RepID=A0A3Q3DRS7_HIPCM